MPHNMDLKVGTVHCSGISERGGEGGLIPAASGVPYNMDLKAGAVDCSWISEGGLIPAASEGLTTLTSIVCLWWSSFIWHQRKDLFLHSTALNVLYQYLK